MLYSEKIENEKELKRLSIDRLFNLQKMLLKQIRNCMQNYIYDKNDIFNILEEIEVINLVISKKIKKNKKSFS